MAIDQRNYFEPDIECAPPEVIRWTQSRRLVRMVERAYNNVPFYKQKFDEIGLRPEDIKSIDDISKLPFTNKSDLRDNYPFGLLAVPKEEQVRIHASSGTTGKRTVVAYTKNDIDVWSRCVARAFMSIGATKKDNIHVSYGYGLFTGGLGIHYGVEKLGATVIPVSTGNTDLQIQIMQDFGSDIICCTPSYANVIAEKMKAKGIDPKSLRLRAGFFGAEPWTEGMRAMIEDGLGIKAYDIYGLSEIAGPGVAAECEMQDGMHIAEDYFYPEIIDPETGEQLPEGTFGELVFTCIGKEALPLIRYRTHDICALNRWPCACGRTLVRMTKPRGRSDDMLIIRGVNVFPSEVEYCLTSMGIQPNYQIIVDRVNNLDTMELRVEMSGEIFSDTVRGLKEVEQALGAKMKSDLGVVVKVTFVEPNSIERFEGKAKRVIDNRKWDK